MKYKCLASVILLLSGAPAFAGDVRLSGYGRFGLDNNNANASYGRFVLDNNNGNAPVSDQGADIADPDFGSQTDMYSPPSVGDSIVERSVPGLDLEFGSFFEYNAYSTSGSSFAGVQADISYSSSLGPNAVWTIGANVIGQQYLNGPGFVEVEPYISVQGRNSFVNFGYVTPADAFVTPNFTNGVFFYSYANDMLWAEPGVLAGTEINNKYLIVVSIDQNRVASVGAKARINDTYSVIAGASANLQGGGADGFVGVTANYERIRAQGLFTFYNGGFFAEAQIDYSVTDRLTATAYAQTNQSSSGYFLSGTYRVLTDFGSGTNVDLFAGFGSDRRVSAGIRVVY